jgi:hypothetical protein
MLAPGAEPDVRAAEVCVGDDELNVRLADGRRLSVPLAWFPRLLHAKQSAREHFQFVSQGRAIHWPDLELELAVERLLAGSAAPRACSRAAGWDQAMPVLQYLLLVAIVGGITAAIANACFWSAEPNTRRVAAIAAAVASTAALHQIWWQRRAAEPAQ